MDVVKETIMKYIDEPPTNCYQCKFSCIQQPSGLLHCFIDSIHWGNNWRANSEKRVVSADRDGCKSEVFIKKVMEII